MTLDRPHPDPVVHQQHRLSGAIVVLVITGIAIVSDAIAGNTGLSFFVVIVVAVRAIINAVDALFEISTSGARAGVQSTPGEIQLVCACKGFDESSGLPLCTPKNNPSHYDRHLI